MTTTPKPETDGAEAMSEGYTKEYVMGRGAAAIAEEMQSIGNQQIELSNANNTIQSENARLREQVKEMREVLRPFADWWIAAEDGASNKNLPITGVEMVWSLEDYEDDGWPDNFRRARDLLEKTNA